MLKTAAFLHTVNWGYNKDSFELSRNIFLCNAKNSLPWKLYEKLCEIDAVDEGDPYNFGAYILFDPDPSSFHLDHYRTSYSLLDRIINVIAIVFSQPVCHIRLLTSEDNFKSKNFTTLDYFYREQTDFLEVQRKDYFDDVSLFKIKNIWENVSGFWDKEKSIGRLNSALSYYFNAWNSHYLDQTCIYLSITLETLFSPSSQSELSHQISFHISKFLCETRESQDELYREMKSFYNIRSKIIHGSVPDYNKIDEIIVPTFHNVSSILEKILLSKELCEIFNDNKKRVKYLHQQLFV